MLIKLWGKFVQQYMGKDWKLGQQPAPDAAAALAAAKERTPASAGEHQQQQQARTPSPHPNGKVSVWGLQSK